MTVKSALTPVLRSIVDNEISAGNLVEGEYENEFANCQLLVVLKDPFKRLHEVPDSIEKFLNEDSHYPLGRGFKDGAKSQIVMAPIKR